MAGIYDSVSEEELAEYAKKAGLDGKSPRDLEQFLRVLKKGTRLLEVGCGTGRIGRYLIDDFDYIGIDNHKPYLNSFREFLRRKGYDTIDERVIECSFQNFKGKGFDAILFPWSFICDFNEEEQMKMIRKAMEMVNPRGTILLDNPSKTSEYNIVSGHHYQGFFFEDRIEQLKSIGFSRIERRQYETITERKRDLIILEK